MIIPAIDLVEGKCVRLRQGKMDSVEVMRLDPVATAVNWQEQGAKKLHVVDIAAAMSGKPVHMKEIQKICQALAIPVQVGGGIRNRSVAQQYLELGVASVVVGTWLFQAPEEIKELLTEYPGRIIASIDVRQRRPVSHGWQQVQGASLDEMLEQVTDLGIETILTTAVTRDGLMQGPDFELYSYLVSQFKGQVIASGGVRNQTDVRRLEKVGCRECICGRALYTGQLKLT